MSAAKQTQIPGTEDKKDPELSKLADSYVEVRDARMQLTAKEVAAKAALLTAMVNRKLDVYRDPETAVVVTIENGEPKLKVKAPKDEDDGSEND